MVDWTIEIETDFTGLDVDGLERFADAFEHGFGYMGPSCALVEGRLAFTVSVSAANADEAVKAAISAANASLHAADAESEGVDVTRLSMESERELAVV